MKAFFDIVKKRRSIRAFEDKQVPSDLINKIIDAARWAPSGLNLQPWRFIVVKDRKIKKQVTAIYASARKKLGLYKQDTSFVENPALIFVLSDKKVPYATLSVFLAIENIVLAATALNLGSVVMTAICAEENKLRKLLKVPSKYKIEALVPVGYSAEKPKPKPRKSLKEIIINLKNQ